MTSKKNNVNIQVKIIVTISIVNTAYRHKIHEDTTIQKTRTINTAYRRPIHEKTTKLQEQRDKLLGNEDQALCKIGVFFCSRREQDQDKFYIITRFIVMTEKQHKLPYTIHNDTYY